jgi:hypothetical protein
MGQMSQRRIVPQLATAMNLCAFIVQLFGGAPVPDQSVDRAATGPWRLLCQILE